MQYEQLACPSLRVSRVGFGCWPLGGHGWGPVDDGASVTAVRASLDAGVTFFDTADVYGLGHSEDILSRALGSDRHRVVVATKFGVRWDETGATWRDTSLAWLDQALDASLRRLRLDCIPLYQIHWHDGVTALDAVVERLLRHREAGKIAAIGGSNCTPEHIVRLTAAGPIASMQVAYSAVDRRAEERVFAACDDAGVPVVTHSSLAQGLCSGKYGLGARFDHGDIRRRSAYFGESASLAVVSRMREVGDGYGKTPAQVALGWVLGAASVASALVGIKTAEQLWENVDVLWNMTAAERQYIADGTRVQHPPIDMETAKTL